MLERINIPLLDPRAEKTRALLEAILEGALRDKDRGLGALVGCRVDLLQTARSHAMSCVTCVYGDKAITSPGV